MNWFKRKKSPEITKSKSIKIEVGQTYLDKKWEDTLLEITAISKDGTEIRYVFLKIEGQFISTPRSKHTCHISMLNNYKLIDF